MGVDRIGWEHGLAQPVRINSIKTDVVLLD